MSNERTVVKKYEGYGLIAGVGVGLLLGVMYSGPHFHDWPAGASLLAIFGSGVAGAVVGYLAVVIAVSSTARGPSVDSGTSDIALGSGGHSGTGDGGGTGGNGGGSGGDGGGSDG
jgi:hypothetical protein